MSGLQYIEHSYNKPRRFKNGTLKLELHPDGILIHGTAEFEGETRGDGILGGNPPFITMCDRIVHWQLLDSAQTNVLEYDIGLVVENLRLVEMNDADC